MNLDPEEPLDESAESSEPVNTPAPQKRRRPKYWFPLLATAVVAAITAAAFVVPRVVSAVTDASATDAIDPTLDSDDDGIPDVLEISGWAVASGERYVTNVNDPDTDGDGLLDGEEAGPPLSESDSPLVFAGVSNPLLPDADSDGLSDFAEVRSWSTQAGARFTTDPLNPDGDGDGLFDGDEAGKLIDRDAQIYASFSDPELADTDEDGLSDAQEADNGSDPYLADTDADGLDDAQEIQLVGTDPLNADTDEDGYTDSFEETNREEQGLDPLFVDVEISTWEYAGDFAKGALAGDAWRDDSIAWLAGNLVASGSSFIPGFGWVVGGVADARDTIANAIQADWVGVGYSAVGLIPFVGDAASISKKTVAFVARNPHLAAAVGALIVSLNKVPESIKIEAAKKIWSEWDTLVKAGASEKALLKVQKSGRVDLDALGAATKRAGYVPGPASKFLADGAAGETALKNALSETGIAVSTQVRLTTSGCLAVCNPVTRVVDVLADGIAYESKVGYKTLTAEIKSQINSDAYLIKTGAIKGAHWDFYPSAHTHHVGTSPQLLDLLEENGITFTIHMPFAK